MRKRALGAEVLQKPDRRPQVIGILNEELVSILGGASTIGAFVDGFSAASAVNSRELAGVNFANLTETTLSSASTRSKPRQ